MDPRHPGGGHTSELQHLSEMSDRSPPSNHPQNGLPNSGNLGLVTTAPIESNLWNPNNKNTTGGFGDLLSDPDVIGYRSDNELIRKHQEQSAVYSGSSSPDLQRSEDTPSPKLLLLPKPTHEKRDSSRVFEVDRSPGEIHFYQFCDPIQGPWTDKLTMEVRPLSQTMDHPSDGAGVEFPPPPGNSPRLTDERAKDGQRCIASGALVAYEKNRFYGEGDYKHHVPSDRETAPIHTGPSLPRYAAPPHTQLPCSALPLPDDRHFQMQDPVHEQDQATLTAKLGPLPEQFSQDMMPSHHQSGFIGNGVAPDQIGSAQRTSIEFIDGVNQGRGFCNQSGNSTGFYTTIPADQQHLASVYQRKDAGSQPVGYSGSHDQGYGCAQRGVDNGSIGGQGYQINQNIGQFHGSGEQFVPDSNQNTCSGNGSGSNQDHGIQSIGYGQQQLQSNNHGHTGYQGIGQAAAPNSGDQFMPYPNASYGSAQRAVPIKPCPPYSPARYKPYQPNRSYQGRDRRLHSNNRHEQAPAHPFVNPTTHCHQDLEQFAVSRVGDQFMDNHNRSDSSGQCTIPRNPPPYSAASYGPYGLMPPFQRCKEEDRQLRHSGSHEKSVEHVQPSLSYLANDQGWDRAELKGNNHPHDSISTQIRTSDANHIPPHGHDLAQIQDLAGPFVGSHERLGQEANSYALQDISINPCPPSHSAMNYELSQLTPPYDQMYEAAQPAQVDGHVEQGHNSHWNDNTLTPNQIGPLEPSYLGYDLIESPDSICFPIEGQQSANGVELSTPNRMNTEYQLLPSGDQSPKPNDPFQQAQQELLDGFEPMEVDERKIDNNGDSILEPLDYEFPQENWDYQSYSNCVDETDPWKELLPVPEPPTRKKREYPQIKRNAQEQEIRRHDQNSVDSKKKREREKKEREDTRKKKEWLLEQIKLQQETTKEIEKNAYFAHELLGIIHSSDGLQTTFNNEIEDYTTSKQELTRKIDTWRDEGVIKAREKSEITKKAWDEAIEKFRASDSQQDKKTLGSQKTRAKQKAQLMDDKYNVLLNEHNNHRELRLTVLAELFFRRTVTRYMRHIKCLPNHVVADLSDKGRLWELTKLKELLRTDGH